MPAQQINIKDFTADFVSMEPKPICAFMSGSFKDWCEVDRKTWKGTQEVLSRRMLPIWASCGGAQGLAILATAGADQPWDCPHCRDPKKPLLPVYTHIGHTAKKPCGDYSGCIFERGAFNVQPIANDSVWNGLIEEFKVMQSHCGQIEFAPRGWKIIAKGGQGGLTKVQCIKTEGFPIYAAQFHIEMSGTPEISFLIMSNFLSVAKARSLPLKSP